jgi:hypothetical protein
MDYMRIYAKGIIWNCALALTVPLTGWGGFGFGRVIRHASVSVSDSVS